MEQIQQLFFILLSKFIKFLKVFTENPKKCINKIQFTVLHYMQGCTSWQFGIGSYAAGFAKNAGFKLVMTKKKRS